MAPETYYLCFSLIFVYAFILHIVNMIHFRMTDKTLLGRRYKHNSVEYKKLQKFASVRGLSMAVAIGIICMANLAYDIYRILHFNKPDYAHFSLTFFPIAFAIAFVVLVLRAPKILADQSSKKD